MESAPAPSTFVTVVAWIFIVLGGLLALFAIFQNIILFFFILPGDSGHEDIQSSWDALVILLVGFGGTLAWIVKKLASPAIRAEFRS